MARVKKKPKKISNQNSERKKNYRVNLSPRRPLHLLECPLQDLCDNQLPTKCDILRYYHYINTAPSIRFRPIKDKISCRIQRNTTNLVCNGQDWCESQTTCMVRKVINIWTKRAGFDNCIIGESKIRDNIIKLQKRYRDAVRSRYLKGFDNLNDIFESELMNLFDISNKDIKAIIIATRTPEAQDWDLRFLEDQKNLRQMFITRKEDRDYAVRHRVEEERRKKEEERQRQEDERQIEKENQDELWQDTEIFPSESEDSSNGSDTDYKVNYT